MTGRTGHGCEPQLGPLPLVLIPDFRSGHLKTTPGSVEDWLDDGPLFFPGVAGGETQRDVEVPYVRGISRSS